MKQYHRLNSICLVIIAISTIGTFWVWRGELRVWSRGQQQQDIPEALTRSEVEQRKENPTTVVLSVSSSPPSFTTQTPIEKQREKIIPVTFNLAVPFISQAPEKIWTQPWQDACEEAAILMMDAYYKDYKVSIDLAKKEIVKMVTWEESIGWGRSIEIEKIQKIFIEYLKLSAGHTTKIVENSTIDQIKKYVANGQPVYVVADGKILPNPHFQNGGPEYHALVIRGYTADSFITNDPGTQFGENFKYKYNDLMKAIRDWNGGDVKSGRRVVLVIE